MKEQQFKIEGMTCHHCVMAVEVELKDAGFENFNVEIGSAKVTYDGAEESKNKIKSAINDAGYNVIN